MCPIIASSLFHILRFSGAMQFLLVLRTQFLYFFLGRCSRYPSDEFRPITILPSLSKILEKVLRSQMLECLNKNNAMYKFQSGFRNKHNTVSAMLKVIQDLSLGIENNKTSIITYLDFKKAFDLLDHEILLFKLKINFKFSNVACK